jgi:hypothetical protein
MYFSGHFQVKLFPPKNMLDSSDNYVALDEVDKEKDLGVTFQSNLKFDKHISRN